MSATPSQEASVRGVVSAKDAALQSVQVVCQALLLDTSRLHDGVGPDAPKPLGSEEVIGQLLKHYTLQLRELERKAEALRKYKIKVPAEAIRHLDRGLPLESWVGSVRKRLRAAEEDSQRTRESFEGIYDRLDGGLAANAHSVSQSSTEQPSKVVRHS
eukprot:TRINITY_DN44915_c0_g1_i1.p1 TRINITY_DN44915_c0_g1~~TRINITY_DN44915_c0_g1_i1.p1  ORF type:complete len:158 (+),score=22.27 TRINITY_DN44915_c0_g1_i1:233-706(+)